MKPLMTFLFYVENYFINGLKLERYSGDGKIILKPSVPRKDTGHTGRSLEPVKQSNRWPRTQKLVYKEDLPHLPSHWILNEV